MPIVIPPPFRLRVLNALTATIKSVTPANGYYHDVSNAVFRGRVSYSDDDPLPMVSILEDPRNQEQDEAPAGEPVGKGPWNLLVQGFILNDSANPTDPAYAFLADVKRALFASITRNTIMGMRMDQKPSVQSMSIGSGVVRPPDEISSKAYFWLPVRLGLLEAHDSPFT